MGAELIPFVVADASTYVAWGSGIMTFVAALVGSIILWRNSRVDDQRQRELAKETHNSDDANKFRADLQEFTKTLMTEINGLRDRIRKLEDDVITKNKMVLALETRIAQIANILLRDHNIDIDEILPETV